MEKTDPFDQLSDNDKKVAIDAAIAALLLGMRIPSTGKPLYDYVVTEFASCYSVPANLAKYAMRSLGRSLIAQNWELTIKKNGDNFSTKFIPETPGGNGESAK